MLLEPYRKPSAYPVEGTLFFESGSFTEPRASLKVSYRNFFVSAYPVLALQVCAAMCGLYLGAGNLNSSLHACVVSSLVTNSIPKLQLVYFYFMSYKICLETDVIFIYIYMDLIRK